MDIRNFFGKRKKSTSSSAAKSRSASSATASSSQKKARAPEAPALSSSRKNNAASSSTSGGSDTENNSGAAVVALSNKSSAKSDENDSDTTMEGSEPPPVTKKFKAAEMTASLDREEEEQAKQEEKLSSPRRTSPRRTSPRRKHKAPRLSSPPSPVVSGKKLRRRKVVIDSEEDEEDEELERLPASKAVFKSKHSVGSKSTPIRQRKSANRAGNDPASEGRNSNAGKNNGKKTSRAAVKDCDEDEDEDDGGGDDDFQPSEEEEDEREVALAHDEKKPRKRRAAALPEQRAASPKKKAAVERKSTVDIATSAPKYHPPSKLLATHVPFLSSSLVIASPLPKLPDNDPNFDLDLLTPHCLEGLTFVFSGILSTNVAATAATSAEILHSSPNRRDYYTNRKVDCSNSDCELSRDTAVDMIKCLGGRVTSAVSGKTDYLIAGSVLEDGRPVEEGSKCKKCVGLWEGWRDKWRSEYGDDSNCIEKGKNKKVGKSSKDRDPNSLVEIVCGIYEFYGLMVHLSEWKKSTLSESQRLELEERQQPKRKAVSVSSPAARNPYSGSATSAANSSATQAAANPYVKKSTPSNPYVKREVANPYAKKLLPSSNPYTKPSPSVSNPYATKASNATTAPSSSQSNGIHQASGQQLGLNSLWADRYAPRTSRQILGNSDAVNKLRKWLNDWENVFNNPQRQVRSLSGPGGPWKAALLSGPPGIGKTTTATLVARESGRDVLELNASDARSKKALGEALGDVTGSQVLSFSGSGESMKKKTVQKRVIIMDEVDGMGAGDRSGMSELITMIKKSKVPIICICNDRSSQKVRSLTQYCMDLRYRRPTKGVIARCAVDIGRQEGMEVEVNAAEAMAESCGNDIRQVLNSLQMWSCKKSKGSGKDANNMTYRDLKERQSDINKDEVLRVSMFDACRSIVEGSRGLAGADYKKANASLFKRTDAYFVDYMMMGLMVHQNYLKVAMGQYSSAKLTGNEDDEVDVLNRVHEATHAMSDFDMSEANIRGGDQNWALLPLCAVLAVKVGHHAGGPSGGMLPSYPEFAGWLGKNSTRNKKVRLLQELRRHVNYKVSADASELRMSYLPLMREQFQQLLFHRDGAMVAETIALMDEYGLDRDDIFENFDEFLFNSKDLKNKKFGELDSKSKAAFTRAYNSMAHSSQALVAEQGAEKTRRKSTGGKEGGEIGGPELDVVDDDMAAAEEEEEEEDLEALKKKFLKKRKGKSKAATKSNGKKGKKR